MYKVYFENRFGDRTFIGKAIDRDEIFKIAHKDLNARAHPSFKSYYTRSWTNSAGELVLDVGSWSEYYIAVPEN